MNREEGGLERWVQRTLRRVVGGVHPAELFAEAEARLREGVMDGIAPNRIRVQLAPQDFLRLAPRLSELERELRERVAVLTREEGWRILGPVEIDLLSDPALTVGLPRITADVHIPAGNVAHSGVHPTRALRRPRERWWVRLEDGRTAVSFLPFRIGRARDNDLVLPSPLVSRRHAEIVETSADVLVLRDLGSRNGLIVAGERVEQVPLRDSLVVHIGDFTLRFEREQ